MKFLLVLAVALFAPTFVVSDALKQLEGKVRIKRKQEGIVTPVPIDLQRRGPVVSNVFPTDEEKALPAEQALDSNLPSDEKVPPPVMLDAKDTLTPVAEPAEDSGLTEPERVKKQACLKMGYRNCDNSPPVAARAAIRTVMMPEDEMPMEPQYIVSGKKMMPISARTIDPIYSFGPVHVNGVPTGSGFGSASAYGSAAAYSPAFSAAYSPASLQMSSYMPYALMHHQIRRPLLHQAFATASRGPVQIKPEILYYEAPEAPIYLTENEVHHATVQQAEIPDEAPLYCTPIKTRDYKTLPAEDKAPLEPLDKVTHENIKKVSEIKDEITQLNQAAHKIVEQQEKLAKMQNEHYMRAMNIPYRGLDPLMRYHEARVMHNPLALVSMLPMKPEEAPEGPKGVEKESANKTTDESAKKEVVQESSTKLRENTPSEGARYGYYQGYDYGMGPHGYYRDDMRPEMARTYPYAYYDPYGRRSVTGFPVPSLFVRANQAEQTPAKRHRNEETLNDLMNPPTVEEEKTEGGKQTTPKAKRDQGNHRGLVEKRRDE